MQLNPVDLTLQQHVVDKDENNLPAAADDDDDNGNVTRQVTECAVGSYQSSRVQSLHREQAGDTLAVLSAAATSTTIATRLLTVQQATTRVMKSPWSPDSGKRTSLPQRVALLWALYSTMQCNVI